jgi:hypothetical protein
MGQFLRFALLIILVLVGFGTGICGLFAVGATVVDTMSRSSGTDQFAGLIVALGLACIAVAVGCFFAVRALARGLRAHATPAPGAPSPAPAPLSAPPPPPAA